MIYDLQRQRFIRAQEHSYSTALGEIQNGRKESHWMWYIFPQLLGLGKSVTAKYYAIHGIEHARAYLEDELLGTRLIEVSQVLLDSPSGNAVEIFGSTDSMKLQSCMTLFHAAKPGDSVFQKVLVRFFGGFPDQRTLGLIGNETYKGGYSHSVESAWGWLEV